MKINFNRLYTFVTVAYLIFTNSIDNAIASEPSALTKRENIRRPEVPAKLHNSITDYMMREAQALLKMGYIVETERNGEVIVITIPNEELFFPNSIELLESGKDKLMPLVAYLKVEDRFKMILAVHTDNTGSDSYKETLTEDRLDNITQYLSSLARYPDQIIGYAMADDEPIAPNTSYANRQKNRRTEIFIVPSNVLIQKIRKK